MFLEQLLLCTAFHHGVEKIIPVSTLQEAKEYKNKGFHVAAERKGKIVDGFDYGNSPLSYRNDKLKGETLVLTTTNGTNAINIAKDINTTNVRYLKNCFIDSRFDNSRLKERSDLMTGRRRFRYKLCCN